MSGFLEDDKEWIDSLPSPPDDRPPPVPESSWRKFYIDRGFSEEEAAAMAAEIAEEDRKSPDDQMRALYAKEGMPPDMVERGMADRRRNEKWSYALDAILRAELANAANRREDRLRAAHVEVAKHADIVARELAMLVFKPDGAAMLRDQTLTPLLNAISEACSAGQPDAPQITVGGAAARILAVRKEDEPFWGWNDSAMAAGELVDTIDQGSEPDPNRIAEAARSLTVIAQEARAYAAGLKRESRRPQKAALDAAEELSARGYSWPQIAKLLDMRGLRLEPHTAGNIRKSVWARRELRKGNRSRVGVYEDWRRLAA
jgi:hypothetical protein